MNACQRCTRPVDDAFVCSTCASDLEKALGLVAFLEPELDVAISRQSRFTAESDGSPTSTRSLPVNMAASEAAGYLRAILVGWCRLYAEEAHDDLARLDNTLAAMAAYLLRRVEWLRHHEAALDVVDEVTRAVRQCRTVIDAPANRTTFFVCGCLEEFDGLPCVGEIRCYIPADEGDRPRLTCSVCHTTWYSETWLRLGHRILAAQAEAS